MSLRFEENIIKEFDVQQTFGKLFFLSIQPIFENDSEGRRTDFVREQRLTIFSEVKNDQINITIPESTEVPVLNYDDEIELTGDVTALAWLSSYAGYNDSIQSEQAFKIKADGIKKVEKNPKPHRPDNTQKN